MNQKLRNNCIKKYRHVTNSLVLLRKKEKLLNFSLKTLKETSKKLISETKTNLRN